MPRRIQSLGGTGLHAAVTVARDHRQRDRDSRPCPGALPAGRWPRDACGATAAAGRSRCSVAVRSSPCASAGPSPSVLCAERTVAQRLSAWSRPRLRAGHSWWIPRRRRLVGRRRARAPGASSADRSGNGRDQGRSAGQGPQRPARVGSGPGVRTRWRPARCGAVGDQATVANAIVLDGRLDHDVPTVVVLAADTMRWGAGSTWDGAMRRALYGDDPPADPERRARRALQAARRRRPGRGRCRPRHAPPARCRHGPLFGADRHRRRLGTVVGR